ncbi:hypothetical protein ANN_25408 [Periplaneta americana]|uniref:Uncharacterized protein n=1 Tax=Periplaneta americana TaxID=6978 RepID=A0ABQ8S1W0_PERAM|nr:hypothetical protein ANN_25408 [Periplaneta americana]
MPCPSQTSGFNVPNYVRTAPRFTQPPMKLSTGSFPLVKAFQSVVPTTPPHSSAEVMESMGLYLHAPKCLHGTLRSKSTGVRPSERELLDRRLENDTTKHQSVPNTAGGARKETSRDRPGILWSRRNDRKKLDQRKPTAETYNHQIRDPWIPPQDCATTRFHSPEENCVCSLCNDKCDRYHLLKCKDRKKTLSEYSKE